MIYKINKTPAIAGVLSFKKKIMSEQKELTYILGAGASYQSIPVVKTFAKRFEVFINYLDEYKKKSSSMPLPELKLSNEDIEKCRCLLDSFRSHQSFDTYFKKLFHTKKDNEIRFAKKVLHIYFIWEHLTNDIIFKEPKNGGFWKQAKIDKRYDALIAGLLKPTNEKTETFCKTNFITWNYDLNLLSSIKNYFYPDKSYDEFLKEVTKSEAKIWDIDGQISIINLNGYFYSSLFKCHSTLDLLSVNDTITTKITNDYFNNLHLDSDSELIQFAWEMRNNDVIDLVQEKIYNSENLVVIGYTFPLYNRLVDRNYFPPSLFTEAKFTTYIQDPEAEKIRSNFISNFNVKALHEDKIITVKDCDSFFVPSNIHNPKPIDRAPYF